MNSQQACENILTVLGYTTEPQRSEIINQGLTNGNELAALTSKELSLIFDENRNSNRRRLLGNQIVIPITAQTKLEALRYEFQLRNLCNSPMNLPTLTAINIAQSRQFVHRNKTISKQKITVTYHLQ